jgi:Fe2+ or Zn2+ uptake regulation protein
MLDERLHAKAEEILAKAGKKPGEYDEAEYRSALEQAQEAGVVTSTSEVAFADRQSAAADTEAEIAELGHKAEAILRGRGQTTWSDDEMASAIEEAEEEGLVAKASDFIAHGIDLNRPAF